MNLKRVNIFSAGCLMLAAMCFSSCKNNPTNDPNDPKNIAEEHNDAKFNTDKKDDADFVVDLAVLNMEEIRLGKLAQSQGTSKEVKELGKKMEEAHSKSLEELKKLAKDKSITIPDSLSDNPNNDYTSLQNKSGNDFEKSFCDILTDKHKKAIAKCEKASSDAEDIDVKNWANKTLPELRAHLDQSLNCYEKYKQGSSH
jgi:putative membrane protein